MKIALAQINPTVGDLDGNCSKLLTAAKQAYGAGAELVAFPELTLTGYPPDDLLEDVSFVSDEANARAYVTGLLPPDLGCILGGLAKNTLGQGKPLFNAAFLYENGQELARVYKTLLPTYDIFDECRYFEPASERQIVIWRGARLGLHVCEDLWNVGSTTSSLYRVDPVADLAELGADLLINICASPFARNKRQEREALIGAAWEHYKLPYLFVNQVGANTDLVFDGSSCVWDGDKWSYLPSFEEGLLIYDTDHNMVVQLIGPDSTDDGTTSVAAENHPTELELLRDALTLGIKDYFHKTGAFKRVFVGLSGGIDSAVTCALAVRALGPENVSGVAMPSVFSSEGSLRDARALANQLGIELLEIPIHEIVSAFGGGLCSAFRGTAAGTAEENIQARIRGTLLMALANKFDGIVLNTGNKSEMSMGYATLYGDMNGALGVLGDVYKTDVYALARLLNSKEPCIPEATITKPPSAELRPDQTDQDSLPPYEDLDRVLKCFIEHRRPSASIADETGLNLPLVEHIVRQVNRNDYKRNQAPPSLRVTTKAFGTGRRLPIVKRRTATPSFAASPRPNGSLQSQDR